MNGWVVLLWSFVAALVLIVGGVFVSLVLMGRITLFPDAQSSAAPTPEETGIVDTAYPVLVLNATPEDGLDVQIRDELIAAGWDGGAVTSGPAGEQRDETVVYYVGEEDELAAIGLAHLIGGANVAQSDLYADPTAPVQQLVIVIGLDRSSVVPEPEETPAE